MFTINVQEVIESTVQELVQLTEIQLVCNFYSAKSGKGVYIEV